MLGLSAKQTVNNMKNQTIVFSLILLGAALAVPSSAADSPSQEGDGNCNYNIASECAPSGTCTMNVAGAYCEGSCEVNIAADCYEGASCQVNIGSTCGDTEAVLKYVQD